MRTHHPARRSSTDFGGWGRLLSIYGREKPDPGVWQPAHAHGPGGATRQPPVRELVRQLKRLLDPDGLMNPGALGLP